MSDELLPCPFCGSDDIDSFPVGGSLGVSTPYRACKHCGTLGPDEVNGHHWNLRALDQEAPGVTWRDCYKAFLDVMKNRRPT